MAGSAQALLVAACISGYSIIDAAGVRLGGAAAYTPLRFILAALLVTLLVLVQQRDVWARARAVLRPALIVGCGNLGAYALVLAAYGTAPVAYAGALREISIVIGALAGWRLFGEPFGARRVIGAGIIAVGIIVITGWGGLA
jgi:drug/metabolite transporter (DMT)-like permease